MDTPLPKLTCQDFSPFPQATNLSTCLHRQSSSHWESIALVPWIVKEVTESSLRKLSIKFGQIIGQFIRRGQIGIEANWKVHCHHKISNDSINSPKQKLGTNGRSIKVLTTGKENYRIIYWNKKRLYALPVVVHATIFKNMKPLWLCRCHKKTWQKHRSNAAKW